MELATVYLFGIPIFMFIAASVTRKFFISILVGLSWPFVAVIWILIATVNLMR